MNLHNRNWDLSHNKKTTDRLYDISIFDSRKALCGMRIPDPCIFDVISDFPEAGEKLSGQKKEWRVLSYWMMVPDVWYNYHYLPVR